MSRTLSPSRDSKAPTKIGEVQHLVLEDVTWGLYEKLLEDIGSRPIRVTFDEGRMEIMSPLPEHEDPKKLIARMIEMLTFQMGKPMKSMGSTTFRRKDKRKGLEPDECYYFKNEARMRGRKKLNLKKDPPPELVVEVDITSRSIDREPIYAALGVSEIWRYDGRKLQCLQLHDGNYRLRKYSLVFPFLEPAQLQQFIGMVPKVGETMMIHRFVAWAKKNGWLP